MAVPDYRNPLDAVSGPEADRRELMLAVPPRGYATLEICGDSMAQMAHSYSAGFIQSSAREIAGWMEFLSKGRLRCPVWHDDNDPYGRNYTGYNYGVSGTGIVSIASRGAAARSRKADVVVHGGLTNDVDTLSSVDYLADIALNEISLHARNGSIVVYRSIPVRSTWAVSGRTQVNTDAVDKKRAARLNELMRVGILSIPGAYFWDVNSVRAKPTLGLAGAQFDDYVVADATHSTMAGAATEAKALWTQLLSKLLPKTLSILPSSDNIYDAALNPYGWMTNNVPSACNPRLAGSLAASQTGTSGVRPTNVTFDRNGGDGSAVGSKLTGGYTTDGEHSLIDAMRVEVTPGASDTIHQLRFGSWLHGLPVGTWVEAMALVDIHKSANYWKGVLIQAIDKTGSTTNQASYGLAPYDPGSANHAIGQRSLPAMDLCGTIWSTPFQVMGDTFDLRLPISYWGGASGTGQVDALFLGIHPISDPTVLPS